MFFAERRHRLFSGKMIQREFLFYLFSQYVCLDLWHLNYFLMINTERGIAKFYIIGIGTKLNSGENKMKNFFIKTWTYNPGKMSLNFVY